jgi:Na+/H+-dicarboxylate symporter
MIAAPGAAPGPRLSLSARIGIAIAAGVAVGLFFGERAAPLQVLADAYIKLLQMTVLPYVTVSIVSGLGGLAATEIRTLGRRVGVILIVMWILGLTIVMLTPLAFPVKEDASFFSAALLDEREQFDFLSLYIPTNPFYSLANNVVPAVVLFSIVVGVALTAVPDKARLLDVLQVAGKAVSKTTDFIVGLTPYGMFAIGASVAGTMSLEELGKLKVYVVAYIAISLLLSLWVLPGLAAALTPVPYRALLTRTRDALVMAFMTQSLFAVLPLLTEQVKALVREHARVDADANLEVIVPASFNFPSTGKLMTVGFLLFAGWFAGVPVALHDYPRLAMTSLFALFGSTNAAIPFLLDLFRIPADTFRLFVSAGIINGRFGALLGAVHTLAIAVLGACAMTGTLTISAGRLLRYLAVTILLTASVVGGTRVMLGAGVSRAYSKDAVLAGMQMLRDRGHATAFAAGDAVPPLPPVQTSTLDRVRSRRMLRVGYFADNLPYVFRNAHGDLVGFDVEMALQLARDLGVDAEFVTVERTLFETGLDAAVCDIVMSGVAVTAERAASVQFSTSYLDETVAFIVPDHLSPKFAEWASVRAMGRLRIGMPGAGYYTQKIRDELKDAEIVRLDSIDELFEPHEPPLDAIVLTAERGSAYTLMHPEYSVAVPKPRPFKVPLAYVIAGRDAAMTSLVNTWIELKRKDGTIDGLFNHWILGQDDRAKPPRWSIVRDVLHWVR